MTQTKNSVLHAIHGILLLNKPLHMTSNVALQKAKRLFGAKKAGHTGSLDPLATGMLPLCFGEATKFCQYLLDADKCYDVVGRLGSKTNTGDAAGVVIASVDHVHVTEDALRQVLTEFMGPIQQVPSMFSALKHQGKPLYTFARAGIEIERAARTVNIYQLDLHAFDGIDFHCTVTCSKGTYIRNLIEDIGERLGVGAHVNKLHRRFTAGFAHLPMYTLEDLSAKSHEDLMTCLLDMELAVKDYPVYRLDDFSMHELYQGKCVHVDIQELAGQGVRLHSPQMTFIGLGDVDETGLLKVRRLLAREQE